MSLRSGVRFLSLEEKLVFESLSLESRLSWLESILAPAWASFLASRDPSLDR
jgi:hypothetical protein